KAGKDRERMKLIAIVSGFLILLAGCLPARRLASSPTPTVDTNFHLYLLVGQSNMAGRGQVDSASKTIDSAILTLDSNGAWRYAMDPIHFDKSFAGVGPGISFAHTMLSKEPTPNIRIGLI